MNEQWKSWEGQTVDGKFLLRQLLATTDHSAIFLTQFAAPEPRDAVLKCVSGDTPAADARLSVWKRAAQLSHPHLIAIFDSGRCFIDGRNLIYVVMEHAEENLGEILPQRALSAEEARDVLEPALDVLVYLHSKGLVHGHLKPSNLLATQDCLKLSSDALLTLGAPFALFRSRDIYDAPELPSGPPSVASDVWSLGATLLEALTRHAPELPQNPVVDPAIPAALPPLFADIIGHSLRCRPEQRWSVGDIAARLNPAPLAAAAAASASPVSLAAPLPIPSSSEPAAPPARLPSPVVPLPRPSAAAANGKQSSPFDYFVPVLLGAAVFFGLIFALPKIFNFRSQSSSSQVAATSGPRTVSQPIEPAKTVEPSPAAEKAAVAIPPPAPVDRKSDPGPAVAPVAPAVLRGSDPSDPAPVKPAADSEGQSEVLDQVLPHAAPKALATIQGTVRVVVTLQVDASGNVTGTNLETPGPSHYFADLAEKAAQQWKFSGAETQGHAVPSTWQIRFDFMSSGVKAFPKQVTP
jgi:TonB family protein